MTNGFPHYGVKKLQDIYTSNGMEMKKILQRFQTSVYGTHSTNGGVTFLPSQKISNQSFPYPNTGPCSGCVTNYRGDYDGIVSNGKASMSAWFDGRVANVWGSYTGYYPDFAMKVNPANIICN